MVMHRQAPTLDRRATLAIAAPGDFNDYGEYEQGVVTNHAVWAALKDSLIALETAVDGVQQEADVSLIMRYRSDVIIESTNSAVSADTGLPFIGWSLQFEGVSYLPVEAKELPMYGRRRFMEVKGRLET